MKTFEWLASEAERRFWPLLTALLLVFVAGTFLWYSADSSEVYFKNYSTQKAVPLPAGRDELQVPLWQFDLAPGDTLRIPMRLPTDGTDGHWFVEILGHPIGSKAGGAIHLNDKRLEVEASLGPLWHRVQLDAPPRAGRSHFELRYSAGDPGETGARFRVWGAYSEKRRSKFSTHPKLVFDGREFALPLPEPISIRRGNLGSSHPQRWRAAYRSSSVDPYFRVGVRTRFISTKWIGDKLIRISIGLLASLLLLLFVTFTIRHPATGLAVLVITLAALWLRWSALGGLAEQYERTANGLTVRHSIWWDTARYFTLALNIFNNETPGSLVWPIGMPTFSAYLFQWSGLHPLGPKLGFVFLQTMVGPVLFFACRRWVRIEALAFVPLLLWSAFLRPIKYSYFYLTETPAMFLMIAWVAILISRDPKDRGSDWFWMIASSSILFVLSGYSRDIIIPFLPAFLGMIWLLAGGRPSHRLTSAAGALAVVVVLWCATPILFSNKHFGLNPSKFLAVSPSHFAKVEGRREGYGLEKSLRKLMDRPGGAVSNAIRFWNPHYRWANRADWMTDKASIKIRKRESSDPSMYSMGEPNVRGAYENSVPARYLLSDNPGGNYARLLKLAGATALFGLAFSQRWRALAGLLLYATLFHAILFSDFTARPRAIFFPVIVLFASLGVFATLEPFPAWLRARGVLGRRLPET